jgi:acetoin utilization protein AcuB
MNVDVWMTRPAITIPADVPASLALRKMMEHEIRRLPVVDEDDQLIGLITDRDLRAALPPHGIPRQDEEYRPSPDDPPVSRLMRRSVTVVAPTDNLRTAVYRMHDQRITGLPVCEGRHVVGVITVQDLLEVLLVAMDRLGGDALQEPHEVSS